MLAQDNLLSLYVDQSGIISFTSNFWLIEDTQATLVQCGNWHHLLLRISDSFVYLFLDGALQWQAYTPSKEILCPDTLRLGGYVGYMDEFAFRRNASSETPAIPEYPYDTIIIQEGNSEGTPTESNSVQAPVSRVTWSCNNLPNGLTLSENGVLTGHPTIAGTYECNVNVSTNWGTATKTITITVE